MFGDEGDDERTAVPRDPDDVDDAPTISCERCDHEWNLTHELETLKAGNQAIEQFALDHRRHTGHFPDGVSTWLADCRQCPADAEHLDERPARRWAETHARHTRHAVDVDHVDQERTVTVGGDAGESER